MKLIVKKVLNNNVLLTKTSDDELRIIMGKGIGWSIKPGDTFDSENSKIDETFIIEDKSYANTFQEMIKHVSVQDVKLADKIIEDGEKELGYTCTMNILFSLSDHISFMLKRIKNKEEFTNPLEWDIKTIYPKEYQYSLKAVAYLKQQTGLNIPKEEGAFIALHFINNHYDSNNMHQTYEITKIIQSVLNIINYHYTKEFDQSSYAFSRFIVHLRYFVLRQLHSESDDTGASLLNIVSLKYPKDYSCAQKIKDFLEKTYSWNIDNGELLYLTLHLNRLSSSNK